jgi:hypothetical protein
MTAMFGSSCREFFTATIGRVVIGQHSFVVVRNPTSI